MQSPDEIFYDVEKQVLDHAHEQFNLLCRNEEHAIYALLQCYATILRDLRTGKIAKPNDESRWLTANDGFRGLCWCLRWIKKSCTSNVVVPFSGNHQAFAESLELLRWGVKYDPIFGEHSAYRGKMANVDVDRPKKTISFHDKYNASPYFYYSQIEAQKADDQRQQQTCPEKQLANMFKAWFDSVRFTSRGLQFDNAKIAGSGALDVAVQWMEQTCIPELSGTAKLHECTVADLRRVLAALYVHSLFVTRLEDVSDNSGPSSGFVLGSHVISGSMSDVVRWLADLSGVAESAVKAIVATLTFDANNPHVTLAQQPFIQSRKGSMFLLPRLFMAISLSLPRMYVSALNKMDESKRKYADTINIIEKAGVHAIAEDLRKQLTNGFHITEQKRFTLSRSNNPIQPDIVIVGGDDEVLVIDVKHAIPPFGALDIRHDVNGVEEEGGWKPRMSEYVSAFSHHPEMLKQHLQGIQTPASIYGMILLRWPFPIPVEFQPPLCAVDWPSLINHLAQSTPISISELFNWAKSRYDPACLPKLTWKQTETRVSDWTYRYSVFVPSSEE